MEIVSPPSFSQLLAILQRNKMSNLQTFAREIGIQPAHSKKETIQRIMAELKKVIRLITVELPDDWQEKQ